MAQFDFITSWDDSWAVLDAILKRPGTKLVHDLWYPNQRPVFYTELNEVVREEIRKRPSLYVFGEDYSRFPIEMRAVNRQSPQKTYMIDQDKGGPLLGITIAGGYVSNGALIFGPNIFSQQEDYFNPSTASWEKASAEVKAAYQDIKARMKLHMLRHRFPDTFVWIGKDAFHAAKDGKAKVFLMGTVREL